MEIIKKMTVGLAVLTVSAVIFFMLIKEQKFRQDVLRTALELFGKELTAMVPDGPQKRAIVEMINSYIDQAERNNVPAEEIQKTIAQGLNMSLDRRPPTPEELQKLFVIRDSLRHVRHEQRPPMERERLAREITAMIALRRELEQVEKSSETDSLRRVISAQVFFAADSGLKVYIPSEWHDRRGDKPSREWRDRMRQFQHDKLMITYDLKNLPEELGHVSPLPPNAMVEMLQRLRRGQLVMDSLNLPPFMTDPDSIEAFIARVQQAQVIVSAP